jgi:cytochrome c peroxidase
MEEQALKPIDNPAEMAQDLDQLVAELSKVPEYAARFRSADPDKGITKETIARALAAFERTLVSADSAYDRYHRGDPTALSPEEQEGFRVFVSKGLCVKCHNGPQLTDNSFRNIGVKGADEGRYRLVPVALMKGAFKTPGLRDVELTAPYFHDGSARTLEDVVAHYDRGGDIKDNLDPDIKPLHLTAAEKAALVVFMRSLTGRPVVVEAPRLPGAGAAPDVKSAPIRGPR